MRVLILLIVYVASQKEPCTPTQWFWKNSRSIFVDPVLMRINYVMYTTNKTVVKHLPVYSERLPLNERCAKAGAEKWLDLLQITIKLVTGITLSDWIPILIMDPALMYTLQTLDVCNKISSVANLPP